MEKRKLWAVAGAMLLTFSLAGVALATDLLDGQVGTTLGDYEGDEETCADWPESLPIGAGEVGVHFILTSPEADSGKLSATFSNPASSVSDVDDWDTPATALHWYIVIEGDADTVIESAETDVDGNNLVVSHTCFGEAEESEEPSDEPSFEASEGAETDEPSFEASEEAETDEPTEPPTNTVGGGTSGPADSAWLLVVALGVFLASVVVLTPARARSR